jgi:SAM-dependent methyltransferase
VSEPTVPATAMFQDDQAYDRFMGRYSTQLAPVFANAAGITSGTALDVGCGPGALTRELIARLGLDHVAACDPSPPFVAACAARHPGLDVRVAPAEAIPFDDDRFDAALAQLVLHFVTDADRAAAEMTRVVRPGGTVAACVWDLAEGMQLLHVFWQAALSVVPDAPVEGRVRPFGGPGEIVDLFRRTGLDGVTESELRVSSTYADFDELWSTYLLGVGPAGAFLTGVDDERRAAIRDALHEHLGRPSGAVTLAGMARCAVGRVPA